MVGTLTLMVPVWDYGIGAMHVVSHKAIRTFFEAHPHARTAMDHWYRVAKRAIWPNFADVTRSFNAADFVAP